MNPEFWHQRWASNQIGFHESAANPLLVKHFDKLNLPKGNRVFLPLCGKTLDIAWLLTKGYEVVGAELNKLAIDQLFAELGKDPIISHEGNIQRCHTDHLDILVGNIFDVTSSMLGKVDAIYDRAAMVALPPEMRVKYAHHLLMITNTASQLLICFDYDQSLVDGPPFSINAHEVRGHYADRYELALLDSSPTKLKGQFDTMEMTWLLETKQHDN